MVTLTNTTTGESYKVFGVIANENGRIVSNDDNPKGQRFVTKWEELGALVELHDEDGNQYFVAGAGFELLTGRRTKTKKPSEPKPEPKPETEKPEAELATEETPTPTPTNEVSEDAQQLLSLLGKVAGKGAAVDEGKVRDIIREELSKLATEQPAKVRAIVNKAKTNGEEIYCEDFEAICEDVSAGYNVYLYGAAGCGKSHTAEQVARRLGLNYYECMQMEFAHDVKGYGDAQGRYVETALYKAMTDEKGALLFLDEFDRSNSQVTTVLNAVMEARRFDFPVVGMVQANPKFRIMAAGNTTMTGLNDEYVAANVIDASTRNRFVMYEAKYDRRVELPIIAKGDEELVNFMEDVRQSVSAANISLIASYRNTRYLCEHGKDKESALKRSLFAGIEADTLHTIYGGLKDSNNSWAKALRKLCK